MRKGRARFSKIDDSCYFKIDDKNEIFSKKLLINSLERTKNEGDIKITLMYKKHGKYKFNFVFKDKDSVEIYNVSKEDANFKKLKSMANVNVTLLKRVAVIAAIVASGAVFSITPPGKQVVTEANQKFKDFIEYVDAKDEFSYDLGIIRVYDIQLDTPKGVKVYDDMQDLLHKYNNEEMIEYLKMSEEDQELLNYYSDRALEFYTENREEFIKGMYY